MDLIPDLLLEICYLFFVSQVQSTLWMKMKRLALKTHAASFGFLSCTSFKMSKERQRTALEEDGNIRGLMFPETWRWRNAAESNIRLLAISQEYTSVLSTAINPAILESVHPTQCNKVQSWKSSRSSMTRQMRSASQAAGVWISLCVSVCCTESGGQRGSITVTTDKSQLYWCVCVLCHLTAV